MSGAHREEEEDEEEFSTSARRRRRYTSGLTNTPSNSADSKHLGREREREISPLIFRQREKNREMKTEKKNRENREETREREKET